MRAGLAIVVRPLRPAFALNEPLRVRVEYTNGGPGAVEVPDPLLPGGAPLFRLVPEGGGDPITIPPHALKPAWTALPAGRSLGGEIEIRHRALHRAGRYRLEAVVRGRASDPVLVEIRAAHSRWVDIVRYDTPRGHLIETLRAEKGDAPAAAAPPPAAGESGEEAEDDDDGEAPEPEKPSRPGRFQHEGGRRLVLWSALAHPEARHLKHEFGLDVGTIHPEARPRIASHPQGSLPTGRWVAWLEGSTLVTGFVDAYRLALGPVRIETGLVKPELQMLLAGETVPHPPNDLWESLTGPVDRPTFAACLRSADAAGEPDLHFLEMDDAATLVLRHQDTISGHVEVPKAAGVVLADGTRFLTFLARTRDDFWDLLVYRWPPKAKPESVPTPVKMYSYPLSGLDIRCVGGLVHIAAAEQLSESLHIMTFREVRGGGSFENLAYRELAVRRGSGAEWIRLRLDDRGRPWGVFLRERKLYLVHPEAPAPLETVLDSGDPSYWDLIPDISYFLSLSPESGFRKRPIEEILAARVLPGEEAPAGASEPEAVEPPTDGDAGTV